MNPASRDVAAESLLAFWAEAGVDAMLLDEPFDRIEAGKIAPIRLPEKPVAAPIAARAAPAAGPDVSAAVAEARRLAAAAGDLEAW